jgi:thymidylate synthase ThyX
MSKSAWEGVLDDAVDGYEYLVDYGLPAEQARGVLPHDTATKLVATWNLRELLHILFDPECGRLLNKHAQPQVRDLMQKLVDDMTSKSKFLNWLIENA